MQGRVHSCESFGSADGPGVRYLIFLQGCEMRCRYCHNPDTWGKTKGSLMSADELLDQAERYRGYWGKEGGITVSGGEPLLQIDFVRELLHKAKQRNINTCIDTALQPFTREQPFFGTFEALMRDTDRSSWCASWPSSPSVGFAWVSRRQPSRACAAISRSRPPSRVPRASTLTFRLPSHSSRHRRASMTSSPRTTAWSTQRMQRSRGLQRMRSQAMGGSGCAAWRRLIL